MNSNDIDKAYISPYDKIFLTNYAKKPKTASQLKEIQKYERIDLLRDNVMVVEEEKIIWSAF